MNATLMIFYLDTFCKISQIALITPDLGFPRYLSTPASKKESIQTFSKL